MPAILDLQYVRDEVRLSEEDATAELIAGLSEHQADLLWAALIQLKPHLGIECDRVAVELGGSASVVS
jgi:hypothetical protein